MTTHAPKTLRFCFDYISPYAYLAWTQIHALAALHGWEVEPSPVLFAAILDANGQKGPAEIPAKRVYVFKDVLRSAYALRVPLQPPPAHPFNPLLALRVSSLPMAETTRRALIDGLYKETWGGGRGVTDPAVVAEVATAAGLDGAHALEEAQQQSAKDRVRQATDQALAAGAFGVPTMLAGSELFWGLDSFPHLERYLAGDDPIDMSALLRWADLPAQAIRPGSKT